MLFDWLPLLGSIIFVDLILSGDNALVIGAVAARVPDSLRWAAFLIGGGGAIVLRISLTYPIALLLRFPFLQAIGGALLLYITVRLFPLKSRQGETDRSRSWLRIKLSSEHGNFLLAMLAVLAADVTTSLDNIIAIAALAKDDQVLLIVGLLFSMIFLLLASALISGFIKRLPLLLLPAAAILTFTSARLILHDQTVSAWLGGTLSSWWHTLVYIVAFLIVTPFGFFWARGQLASRV
jgi:YjbE family integral membrane protein